MNNHIFFSLLNVIFANVVYILAYTQKAFKRSHFIGSPYRSLEVNTI